MWQSIRTFNIDLNLLLSLLTGIAVSALMGLFWVQITAADTPWFDEDWTHRIEITINHNEVAGGLSNFPVYLDLSDLPSSFFSTVRADGGDIRITESDGVSLVPREVVWVDGGNEAGEVHFQAPSLSSGTDTTFYLYYGNAAATEPAADSAYGSENVWDDDYVLVYHLQETSGAVKDSTKNGLHGTIGAGVTQGTSTVLGKGLAIGTTGGVNIPAYTPAGGLTVSILAMQSTAHANYKSLFTLDGNAYSAFRFDNSNLRQSYFNGSNSDIYRETNSLQGSNGVWYLYTLVHELVSTNVTLKNYRDNSLIGSSVTTDGYTPRYVRNLFSRSTSLGFVGLATEARISNIDRSAAWIASEYSNQSNTATFYSLAAPEAAPAGGGPMMSTNFKMIWDSLNSGGRFGSSANYRLEDTVGGVGTGYSYSSNFDLHAGYQQLDSGTYLGISLVADVLMDAAIPGVTGGSSQGNTTVRVTTNSPAGYYATYESSATPALQGATDSIPDYVPAGASPDYNFLAAAGPNFGYSVWGTEVSQVFLDNGSSCNQSGGSSTSLHCWVGLSTTPRTIATHAASNHPAGATSTLQYRVNVPAGSDVPTGFYTATTTITALPL